MNLGKTILKRNGTSWYPYLASLLTAMLLSSASAQITKSHDASLASSSFYGTDDGMNLTTDAATGLTWLDWTATVNISAADMVNTHLQPGGFLHGWRLATPDELLVVIQNIAPGYDYSAWPGNNFGPVGPGLAWVDHFGDTNSTSGTYGRAYSYDADNDEWWHSYMGDWGGGSQLNGQNGAPTATPPGAFNTIGFALVAAPAAPAAPDNALNFVQGDYVNVANPADFNVGASTDFTVEAIVKTTHDAANQTRAIFSKMVDNFVAGQPIQGYQLWATNGRLTLEWANNGTAAQNISGTTIITDGECHHVAVVVDRSAQNAKLYVDGVLEADVTHSRYGIDIDNAAPVYIGRDRTGGGGFFWWGDMDEVAFFKSARTGAQIAQSATTALSGSEADLTGYWKFDSGVAGGDNTGVTTAIDETGNNDGTLFEFELTGAVGNWVESPCPLSAPDPAAPDNALNFVQGDYVNVANPADFNVGASTDFTIEAIVKTTHDAANQSRAIFSKMVDNFVAGQPIQGYQLWATNGRLTLEWANNGTAAQNISGTTIITDGECHHVAVVVDRSAQNAKLYVDGVLEADVTHSRYGIDIDNAAPVYIGRDRTGGGGFFWWGDMDEVAFFKSARTGAQIAQSATTALSGSEADLTGYWKFDSGVAGGDNTGVTTAIDETGNNDGTLFEFELTGAVGNWVESPCSLSAPDPAPTPDSVLEIGTASTTVSGVATLPITLTGGGDEFALSGSVSFDPTVFSNPQFTVGAGAPASASLTENLTDAANGNAGFLLGLSFGETFAAGSSVVVDLQLTVNAQASKAEHAVTFGDSPSPRGVVNDLAEDLTVTWTDGSVTVINSDPVATDDQENTDEDTVLTVAAPGVLDNDSDPDLADVLTVVPVVSATTPQGASVNIDADGSISYDPTGSSTLNALPAGTDANDTIDYTVEDGDGGSDTGTLQVTVAGVNDAPTAVDDVNIASTDENVVLNVTAAGVLANDTDPDTGDTLSIASVDATSANGAALTLNGDGSIRYDSTAAATVLALADGVDLVDSFTYTVEDALGLQDSATISVTVSGVEFEGDVTPRSNGDNVIDVTDAVMMRRFVVGLETLSAGEFSRVDTAPRSAGGDGKLTVGDFVQTLRYAVGLDAVQRISGPTEPSSPMVAAQVEARVEVDPGSAKISMAPIVGDDGNVALSISMDSLGQVSAVGFSVAFDPAIYRYDAYALAAAAQGKTAFINAQQAAEGRLGIVIANNNVDQTFTDGKIGLLNLNLTTISEARVDGSILEFGDFPASRSVSDTSAKKIPTEYVVSTLGGVVPEVPAMPQTWLSSYFALSDLNDTDKEASVWGADADPDGDGQPNHVEYAAGTSPTDRSSAFVSHIDMSGDAITVSFYPYHEDRRYQLLRSDLEDGSEWTEIRSENWQPSTDASLGEGRSATIKTDGTLGFYRVQVSLPN